MEWLHIIDEALRYIEGHLEDDIGVGDIAHALYSSESHFSRMFNIVTGCTVGEYLRNRRLSLAGAELESGRGRVIDLAMRYCYDSSESFSKAFTRFHGITPSDAKRHGDMLKFFYPLSINISIQGGYTMQRKFLNEFCWNGGSEEEAALTPKERYQRLISWAAKARVQNPRVFDEVVDWMLDDSEWKREHLHENERIVMQGVIGRFKEQNAMLRRSLLELVPSGVVNKAVFSALDYFDAALLGAVENEELNKLVKAVFSDFSLMEKRDIRSRFAGGRTGAEGVESVEYFGYINALKSCDAGVQWALFMPTMVERQKTNAAGSFNVESFECLSLGELRFVGRECFENDEAEAPFHVFAQLDKLGDYASEISYDLLFSHFFGRGVDVEPWHAYCGRFMKPDCPVPEGCVSFDFIKEDDGKVGLPFVSQLALAQFSGNVEAMHSSEGYDVNAMYDVTRNIMLGAGIIIPYPTKYWTAEVFCDGFGKPSTAYMFSTIS